MEFDRDSFLMMLSAMPDEELLKRHASCELTEEAYTVLEQELINRGINVPARPINVINTERPQSLRAHWDGRADLGSAFWLIWVAGNFFFFIYLIAVDSTLLSMMFFPLHFVFLMFAGVCVWRCAHNTKWEAWGIVARLVVLVPPIVYVLIFGALIMEPPMDVIMP